MSKLMTNTEFAAKLIDIVKNYKTLYIMGCYGAPMTEENKKIYIPKYSFNMRPNRVERINAADDETFGFDCVCLIKGVLWGWSGDKTHIDGGADYDSNGVPDICSDVMITVCEGLSEDFSHIEIGEALWELNHIGIYVGNGLAVECSSLWEDGVQLTACNRDVEGYPRRDWVKHGKLPYIEYV